LKISIDIVERHGPNRDENIQIDKKKKDSADKKPNTTASKKD
jgi:hypothetical protein